MSRTSKIARKARLSKQTKGQHAGADKRAKPKCPHQQPAPDWLVHKSSKGKGKNRVGT